MSTGEKAAAPVTRADLYPIFGSIYLLLAFCFWGLVRHDMEQGSSYWIPNSMFFALAIFWTFTYGILGIRERRRNKEQANRTPER